MMRAWASVYLLGSVLLGLAGPVFAAGHFEMVWFRQWPKYESGEVKVLRVHVFDETGTKLTPAEVTLLDHDGVDRGWTTAPGVFDPTHREFELDLVPTEDIGVQCSAGDATSDVSPIVTVAYGQNYGVYSYDVGFVYKADGSTAGHGLDDTFGLIPTRTNNSTDNPYTRGIVYASQTWDDYFAATDWQLMDMGASPTQSIHTQTFVADGIDRILGVYFFGVQPLNAPTQWRVDIHDGGPADPVIASKTTPTRYFFARPLGFGVDECPVTPGGTYTFTVTPVDPTLCNVFYLPGTNYEGGDYYYNGAIQTDKDVFGFVYGWNTGTGTHGEVRGTIVDDELSPASDAVVTLIDESDTSIVGTRMTGADGNYVFGNVAPGSYTVEVVLPGFLIGQDAGNAVVADQTTTVDVTLEPAVQVLTNASFEMGTLAWMPYGDDPPYAVQGPIAAVPAKHADYWLGIMFPAAWTSGGVYQRATTIPGEAYQACFNVRAEGGGGEARIGVDLSGGTDPGAGTVQWTDFQTQEFAWSSEGNTNAYLYFTATGSVTTVFVDYYSTATTSVLAVDGVRLYQLTGAEPSASGDLSTDWSLVSAPLVDVAGEWVGTVFDGVVAAGNDLSDNMFRYNSGLYEAYSVDFSDVHQAVGYWTNLTVSATEAHTGARPDDPVLRPLATGWNLIGQPHAGATPVASLLFEDDEIIPAWHDTVYDDKLKYRSDSGTAGWSWVEDAVTVVEWRVYVKPIVDPVSNDYDRVPSVKIEDSLNVELGFYAEHGWWTPVNNDESIMTVTSGGIDVGLSHPVVLTAPNSWHTVRLVHDDAAATWSLSIDGRTDQLYYMEGTVAPDVGRAEDPGVVQWGVLSSDKYADFYTSYIVWGQNEEIDDWPAGKLYSAATGQDPSVGVGWGMEINGSGVLTRVYEPIGLDTLTLAQAVEADWVEGALVSYEGGYEIIQPVGGDDDAIRPFRGYWLKVNEPGLTLAVPGPAESTPVADDYVSRVRLNLDAAGCMTGNFVAALSPSASDNYDASEDVSAPPAGPPSQKEVILSTTLSGSQLLADVRAMPESGGIKAWAATVSPVNFAVSECQNVSVTWDLTDVGAYEYKLIDVNGGMETILTGGGDYVFEVCDGDSLPFELYACDGTCTATEAAIIGWSSIRTHGGGVGDLEVPLDATDGQATSESRTYGVQLIAVDFDRDVTTDYQAGQIVLQGGLSLVSETLTNGGTRLEIALTGSVNLGCYTIDVAGSVSGLVGDTDCQVAALACDTNSDGIVSSLDRAQLKLASGQPVVLYPDRDTNTDGIISSLDRAQVKLASGNAVTCP